MRVGAGVFGAYTMMKKLLLLAFIAVACEAMAQEDAQCVPERGAMVDTIRAYARFEAGVLGPGPGIECHKQSCD